MSLIQTLRDRADEAEEKCNRLTADKLFYASQYQAGRAGAFREAADMLEAEES